MQVMASMSHPHCVKIYKFYSAQVSSSPIKNFKRL